MYTLLLFINIVSAFVMVAVILLQQGQGAEMGSSFGRGAQGSLIGITGSANLLSRMTSVLALIFFISALALGVVGKQPATDPLLESLTETAPAIELQVADPITEQELEVPAVVDPAGTADENQ